MNFCQTCKSPLACVYGAQQVENEILEKIHSRRSPVSYPV